MALACSDSETTTSAGDPRVDGILALSGDVTNGASRFTSSCGIGNPCHGPDGMATMGGTDLTTRTGANTDAFIVSAIVNGYEGMPAQDTLPDQDVADILAYMRSEWGGG